MLAPVCRALDLAHCNDVLRLPRGAYVKVGIASVQPIEGLELSPRRTV